VNVSETVQLSWKFYWAGVLRVFLATYTILVRSAGNHGIRKLGLLSSAHSLMLILPAYYLIAQFKAFTQAEFASKLGIIFVTGVILIALVVIHEYLRKVNISEINGSHLTSGLLQAKEQELLAGYPAKPLVYNLEIENEEGMFSFGAPWVHPGPLGGFGGATLTQKVIEQKNKEGQGFFLHLPSTHQSDPVHPESGEKIIEAFETPEKGGMASRLIEKSFDDIVLRVEKSGIRNWYS
jgi:putative membrane protein